MINRSTLKAALTAKTDCLSPEELERLLADPLVKHPHLAACPRCQSELAMLKEFEDSAPLPNEGAAVTWISSEMDRRLGQIKKGSAVHARRSTSGPASWLSRLFGNGGVRWLIPVTAIMLAAVIGMILFRSSKQPELRADLGSNPTIYRSQQVDLVAPIGELPSAPKELQWRAFANTTKYKVEVMEVDHAVLWSAESNYISLTIPNAARAKMLPGKPLLWQVAALDGQGRTLAVSQVQRFSVSRKSPVSNRGSLSH